MKNASNRKILLAIFILELLFTSFKLIFQKKIKFDLFCGDPSNDPKIIQSHPEGYLKYKIICLMTTELKNSKVGQN